MGGPSLSAHGAVVRLRIIPKTSTNIHTLPRQPKQLHKCMLNLTASWPLFDIHADMKMTQDDETAASIIAPFLRQRYGTRKRRQGSGG